MPQVHVIPKPVVAILSTGNEIIDIHGGEKTSSEAWGGIWDTNRPSLQTALEGLGYRVIDLGIVHDKFVFCCCPNALPASLIQLLTVQCPRSRCQDPRRNRFRGSDLDDWWDIHGSRRFVKTSY